MSKEYVNEDEDIAYQWILGRFYIYLTISMRGRRGQEGKRRGNQGENREAQQFLQMSGQNENIFRIFVTIIIYIALVRKLLYENSI